MAHPAMPAKTAHLARDPANRDHRDRTPSSRIECSPCHPNARVKPHKDQAGHPVHPVKTGRPEIPVPMGMTANRALSDHPVHQVRLARMAIRDHGDRPVSRVPSCQANDHQPDRLANLDDRVHPAHLVNPVPMAKTVTMDRRELRVNPDPKVHPEPMVTPVLRAVLVTVVHREVANIARRHVLRRDIDKRRNFVCLKFCL